MKRQGKISFVTLPRGPQVRLRQTEGYGTYTCTARCQVKGCKWARSFSCTADEHDPLQRAQAAAGNHLHGGHGA